MLGGDDVLEAGGADAVLAGRQLSGLVLIGEELEALAALLKMSTVHRLYILI